MDAERLAQHNAQLKREADIRDTYIERLKLILSAAVDQASPVDRCRGWHEMARKAISSTPEEFERSLESLADDDSVHARMRDIFPFAR